MELLGPMVARLYVNAAPGALHVAARLSVVHPDGSSRLVGMGIHALSGEGSVEGVDVDLGHTALRLPAGYSLRLSVSGSAGGAFAVSPDPMEAEIVMGPETPSQLLLPLTEGLGSVVTPGGGGGDQDGGPTRGPDAGPTPGEDTESATTDTGISPSFDTGFTPPPEEDVSTGNTADEVVITPRRDDDGCASGQGGFAGWWAGLVSMLLFLNARRRHGARG